MTKHTISDILGELWLYRIASSILLLRNIKAHPPIMLPGCYSILLTPPITPTTISLISLITNLILLISIRTLVYLLAMIKSYWSDTRARICMGYARLMLRPGPSTKLSKMMAMQLKIHIARPTA